MGFSYHPYNNNQRRSTSHGANEGTRKKRHDQHIRYGRTTTYKKKLKSNNKGKYIYIYIYINIYIYGIYSIYIWYIYIYGIYGIHHGRIL